MNTHFLMMAVDSYIGMKLAVENTFILSGNPVRRYEPSYFEQHKCSQNKTNIHTHILTPPLIHMRACVV